MRSPGESSSLVSVVHERHDAVPETVLPVEKRNSDGVRCLEAEQARRVRREHRAGEDARISLAAVESYIQLTEEEKRKVFDLYRRQNIYSQLSQSDEISEEEFSKLWETVGSEREALGEERGAEYERRVTEQYEARAKLQDERTLAFLRRSLKLTKNQSEALRAVWASPDRDAEEMLSYLADSAELADDEVQSLRAVVHEIWMPDQSSVESLLQRMGGEENLPADMSPYFNDGTVRGLAPGKFQLYVLKCLLQGALPDVQYKKISASIDQQMKLAD